MRLALSSVFAFLLALSFTVAAQSRPTNANAAVKKVLSDYKAALERLDLSGVDPLFDPESQVIESGKVEGNYADYLTNHIGPELSHFRSFKFSDYKVTANVQGEIAWTTETYRYTITLKEEGKVIERQGVTTSVLRRTDGDWRILLMHSSSRAPKPAAKSP